MKIGEYEPRVQKKDYDECFGADLAEGDLYWTVKIDKEGYLDVLTQTDAEIISRLVRIELHLENGS